MMLSVVSPPASARLNPDERTLIESPTSTPGWIGPEPSAAPMPPMCEWVSTRPGMMTLPLEVHDPCPRVRETRQVTLPDRDDPSLVHDDMPAVDLGAIDRDHPGVHERDGAVLRRGARCQPAQREETGHRCTEVGGPKQRTCIPQSRASEPAAYPRARAEYRKTRPRTPLIA
jgi:hypothetical protein